MTRTSALVLMLSLAAAAGDLEESVSTIRTADLRAHVEFLASDDLEGRGTLQRGNDTAARYLASQMRRIGLSPAGADGTYFQDVPLWVSSYKYIYFLELRLQAGSRSESWKPFRDFSIAPGSGHDTVEGDVVFAGYGITAPEHGYDDYNGLDVRGKIVVVFRHEPRENDEHSPFDGRKMSAHASFSSKSANALAHGAIGLVILNDPMGGHEPLFETADVIPDTMAQRTEISFEKGADPKVKQGGIPTVFVTLACAGRILGRSVEELTEIQRLIDKNLEPQSFPAKTGTLRVRTQVDARLQTSEQKVTRNVAGVLPGTDPGRMKEVVVVGGHFDHLGIYGSGDDRIFNGADDNASGTSGVLEIAEAFCQLSERPARTMLFICFTGEEIGLLGSQWYVRHPLFPLEDTVAMVNLDMIGRNAQDREENARACLVAGVNTSPGWRELLEARKGTTDLVLTYSQEDPGGSDHIPFRNSRIPVLFFFTGFHDDYHGVGDVAEKINYEKTERVCRYAFRIAHDLATRGRRMDWRDPGEARPERPEAAEIVRRGDGLVLRTLTEEEAQKQKFGPDVMGMRVMRSDRPDLREGDVVAEVNDQPVSDADAFLKLVTSGRKSVSLFVMRSGRGSFFVHLKGKDLEGWHKP